MRKHIRVAAIALIWLFHVSGIIGIVLGYETWFIPKTPLTLLISFILLILLYPMGSMIKYASVLLFFAIGFFVEWIGVTYGFLFGEYYYGNNLGTKIGGVPLMMGITWSMLVLTSGAMVSKLAIPPAFKS
ncbi:MAG: carotenoid biosynthesis protein, partial [Bacteroidota bacterium]